ncbi:hypothetical protein Lalb_Chr08g0234631 [Lupinus albus]|uniref:Uncharacterized protein n=1 Tax=Lupinus albus TaxID=3870 RepID=A0A6A4Q4K0_LUPAL|nr:hypothetical protein Lalb_Chr08g0234631 [Lupinus albus]
MVGLAMIVEVDLWLKRVHQKLFCWLGPESFMFQVDETNYRGGKCFTQITFHFKNLILCEYMT